MITLPKSVPIYNITRENDEWFLNKISEVNSLEDFYTYHPKSMQYLCYVRQIPGGQPIVLYDYRSFKGSISIDDARKKLMEIFGDDMESFFIEQTIEYYIPKLFKLEDFPDGMGTAIYNKLMGENTIEKDNSMYLDYCNYLNVKTPEWCLDNIDTIIEKFRRISVKTNLAFVDFVGKKIIEQCIQSKLQNV